MHFPSHPNSSGRLRRIRVIPLKRLGAKLKCLLKHVFPCSTSQCVCVYMYFPITTMRRSFLRNVTSGNKTLGKKFLEVHPKENWPWHVAVDIFPSKYRQVSGQCHSRVKHTTRGHKAESAQTQPLSWQGCVVLLTALIPKARDSTFLTCRVDHSLK